MLSGVLLCLALAGALATSAAVPTPMAPQHCCFPPTFEAHVTRTYAQKINNDQDDGIIYAIDHVDYPNKRFAVDQLVYDFISTSKSRYLQRATDKNMWLIRPETKDCFKLPKVPFLPCITKNFTYTGVATLGGMGGSSMNVSSFVLNKVINNTKVFVETQVTQDKCVPVVTASIVSNKYFQQVVGEAMNDVTLGIKDPSVFDLPDFCKTARFLNDNHPEVPSATLLMLKYSLRHWF